MSSGTAISSSFGMNPNAEPGFSSLNGHNLKAGTGISSSFGWYPRPGPTFSSGFEDKSFYGSFCLARKQL
jgi:hypothetical protein